MKKLLLWLSLLPSFCFAQPSFNMTLHSNFDIPNLPIRFGSEYSDCWGFRHANGTEVAIIAGIEDIFFVNITSPANPVLIYEYHVENINGTTNQSLWRDFKSYQNYVYAASDEGNAGLLVFNMSNVPNSITMVNQTTAFWATTHNIFIDTLNAKLYAAGSNTQSTGLKILSLATPATPTQLASISLSAYGGGYTHDVYVRDDTAYCSHGSLHKLNIYDMSNLSNIDPLGTIENYWEAGYNHSSWLSASGDYLVMADETAGSDLKLVNVTDPANISNDDIDIFYSELLGAAATGASMAHNPFIKGDLVYIAYYHDGVQVFNIADPNDIYNVAYYDTYPQNTGYTPLYEGCWGVYPYFPSGVIIGSDQTNGLFVMEITNVALPIQFISFNATRKDEDVLLKWVVADASFGNRFEVKRSSDNGASFQTIGTVRLDEAVNHYQFTDQTIQSDQWYIYRIDFIEFDGNKIRSPLQSIVAGQAESVFRIKNPVSSMMIIDLLEPVEQLELHVYDMEGKVCLHFNEDNPGNRIEKSVAGLIDGHYVLSMEWAGGNENRVIEIISD